jgi:hypothetical protein
LTFVSKCQMYTCPPFGIRLVFSMKLLIIYGLILTKPIGVKQ